MNKPAPKPLMILQPVYNRKKVIIPLIPIAIHVSFMLSMVTGLVLSLIYEKMPVVPMCIVGVLVLFCIPFFACKLKQKECNNTKYEIHADKIIYDREIFSVSHRELELSRVREVSMYKGFLQRKYGLGTVNISIEATNGDGGMSISDIPEPECVCEIIKELVDDVRHRSDDTHNVKPAMDNDYEHYPLQL